MAGKGQGGFGFGLGKMKELTEAFKKAQQVQEGAKPRRVEISPDALGEGAEVVSELVAVAMTDAYNKSTATMRERMEELTGGLNLPGL
jgi:DNA-binding protein YbaB